MFGFLAGENIVNNSLRLCTLLLCPCSRKIAINPLIRNSDVMSQGFLFWYIICCLLFKTPIQVFFNIRVVNYLNSESKFWTSFSALLHLAWPSCLHPLSSLITTYAKTCLRSGALCLMCNMVRSCTLYGAGQCKLGLWLFACLSWITVI